MSGMLKQHKPGMTLMSRGTCQLLVKMKISFYAANFIELRKCLDFRLANIKTETYLFKLWVLRHY